MPSVQRQWYVRGSVVEINERANSDRRSSASVPGFRRLIEWPASPLYRSLGSRGVLDGVNQRASLPKGGRLNSRAQEVNVFGFVSVGAPASSHDPGTYTADACRTRDRSCANERRFFQFCRHSESGSREPVSDGLRARFNVIGLTYGAALLSNYSSDERFDRSIANSTRSHSPSVFPDIHIGSPTSNELRNRRTGANGTPRNDSLSQATGPSSR